MVSGEQNLASPSPSPTATATTGVSDPSLSKTHISPSRRSTASRSRRKTVNLLRPFDFNDHCSNTNSPYYKGLTDQSLAILGSYPHPQPYSPSTYLLSLSSSPYYKGLTDYSKVLSPWSPHTPIHPLSYQSSPYYSGLLTDYSFSIYAPPRDGGQSSSSPPNINSFTDFIVHGNASQQISLQEEKPLRVNESEAIESVLHETILDDVLMCDQEKPLRERVSEPQCKEEPNEYVYHYTWATKYQPIALSDFICNKDKALQLKEMVKEGCGCNHFIFEGPPSVGKRSMIRAMLREVFGADRVQVTEEYKNFYLKFLQHDGEMVDNLQVRLKKSLHHVEVNISETKGYEKHVIVDLFKETYGQVINNTQPCQPENCKAIILYEAEKLSIESLLYIKWLLEKYKGCNKVFFCCSDESKLQPVKPLCVTIRLSSPSTQEVFDNKVLMFSMPLSQQLVNILEYIGKEEGIKLSRNSVDKIIFMSNNNQRQAIRSFEATCRNKDALKDDDLILTGWEEDILNIAKKITQEQSPRQ
ncbi:Replication factor C subunit 3, partial [Mucuna pruriens]